MLRHVDKIVTTEGDPASYATYFSPVLLVFYTICTPLSYIFPGLGLGAIAAKALTIEDADFYIAAATLASLVSTDGHTCVRTHRHATVFIVWQTMSNVVASYELFLTLIVK
jgi:hypothetical protein